MVLRTGKKKETVTHIGCFQFEEQNSSIPLVRKEETYKLCSENSYTNILIVILR